MVLLVICSFNAKNDKHFTINGTFHKIVQGENQKISIKINEYKTSISSFMFFTLYSGGVISTLF